MGDTKHYAVLSHGLRIGFRSNRKRVLTSLDSILPPNCRSISSTRLDFLYSFDFGGKGEASTAFFGPEELVRTRSFSRMLSTAASHIEHIVAEHSPEFIFIHAGVIGWRGQAILFPGPSCTGKSTLVQALLRLGAVYFSDEFAVIDSEGLVHPFARPLSLRLPSGRRKLYPNQIGAEISSQPLRAAAVVLTRYAPNSIWRSVPVSPGRAVLELIRNTVAVRSNPARSIEYLKNLVQPSITMRSLRGEADAIAPLILRSVDKYTARKERR